LVIAEKGQLRREYGMAEQQWNRLYFDEWVEKEGLDLIRGHKVDNVFTQPLKPWARTGGVCGADTT